jgi:hypothetical protein
LGQRERQEAQILQQPTSRGQGIRCRVSNGLIMGAAAIGVAQKEDQEEGIDEQDIFDGVVLFLTAITRRLFSRVLGVDDAPFRPIMGKRGEAGVRMGVGSSSSGATTMAASAPETPSRWARALRERAGASPRVRRAASSTGRRTWIHWLALLWPMPNRRPCTTWSAWWCTRALRLIVTDLSQAVCVWANQPVTRSSLEVSGRRAARVAASRAHPPPIIHDRPAQLPLTALGAAATVVREI